MSLRHIILCILMTAVIAPARSQNAAGSYGLMDNLTLTYDGNQLAGVSEAAPDYDFKKKKLKTKIKHIEEDVERKRYGEEHSRSIKR